MMRRLSLFVLLGVILVAGGWLWLRLDAPAERVVSGSLESLLIAFWYHVYTVRADTPSRRP